MQADKQTPVPVNLNEQLQVSLKTSSFIAVISLDWKSVWNSGQKTPLIDFGKNPSFVESVRKKSTEIDSLRLN